MSFHAVELFALSTEPVWCRQLPEPRHPILDAWGCDCCLAGDAQASRATKQALWAPYLELLNAAFPFKSERDVTEQDLQFSDVQS